MADLLVTDPHNCGFVPVPLVSKSLFLCEGKSTFGFNIRISLRICSLSSRFNGYFQDHEITCCLPAVSTKKLFAQNKFKIYLPSRSLFFSSHMIVSFLPLQKVFFVCCGRAATVCGGKRRLLLHVFLVKQPTWPKPTFLGCCRGCGCAIAAVEGRRVPLRAGWSQNIPVEQTSQCYSVSQRGQTRCHCRWEACV